jgi:uncharacterized protein
MRIPPQQRRLADGRLHLQHGPIDLIIEAFGAAPEVEAAYASAWTRFQTVLDELCAELVLLRAAGACGPPAGVVARRMVAAVSPYAVRAFITPMAAVAGAVADEILDVMTAAAPLTRAYVNNGGDIALHLGAGQTFAIGMIDRPDKPSLSGNAVIKAVDPVRGIATSGWRGRSFSCGIADAVTVLAGDAAAADAAATMIANACDLPGHAAVHRVRADEIDPQSDLGRRLVTRGVDVLSARDIATALAGGQRLAWQLQSAGLISAAALRLQGHSMIVEAR